MDIHTANAAVIESSDVNIIWAYRYLHSEQYRVCLASWL